MERQLKTLSKAVALECYVDRSGGRALREIENAYRDVWGDGGIFCGAQGSSKSSTQNII